MGITKFMVLAAAIYVLSSPLFAADTLVTKIATRNNIISIFSTAKGPRYLVSTKSGEVIADKVSIEQLQAKSPEAYQFVKSAVAVDASTGKPSLKAGILDAGTEH